jgi:DNA-binding MarR family transcriptional regulator
MDPLRSQCTDAQMERLLKAMDLLRMLDREMPAQVTSCFLYVASHKNCHKQAMEEYLNIKPASGSRNTDWLSEYHRFGKPGLYLIEKKQDPTNRRRAVLSLTDKGERLVKQLRSILYD